MSRDARGGAQWIMAAAALLFCTLARTNLDNFGSAPWIMAAIALVLMMSAMSLFARGDGRADRLASPILFGLLMIWLWEMLVVGLHVPFVILPPPSAIARAIWRSLPILRIDFEQTYLHSVVAGYAIGCGTGFLLALAIDRSPFLQRGLTPLGNLISAMPIIGIAPIMVMWFGFGWPSKAAVVVLMTVFPMLVNTRAGLASTDAMERDLMRTYAAGYWQTLLHLRLPAAMPMIFNALKLNSTLALIGAVVAEFFGTPIRGMGFRISTEAARMNLDVVWATIGVAAVAGSVSFALIAAVERIVTFWHPSLRGLDRA
jgi:NitT/TauT family transport system permease protein